ncbi:hypothetical protein [Thalassospira sp.]|uniref:hypothetical protein n=1 Tax=Thalassospira sp. TaxID=1912094 RepID=UPI00273743E9|nr:hypothetical protein [Thalassospira sp.]MDP2700131.1 hypothetical protein [Thalassospira sp.]
MKLILSAYLRTLKERDEFDALLPDLLLSMGIIPLSKPQTGTRQFGVDLSAVGVDKDGIEKLFLFVLKKGDIGRRIWNGEGPQCVEPSLDEIFNVYLRSHVPQKHGKHPVKIVLGTTGDLKEEVQPNWAGYTERKKGEAEFDFWGADELAVLIERHLLDEHLFQSDDRTDLRRVLALVGEPDYSLVDFHKLLLRQLGLNVDGELLDNKISTPVLVKALTRANLTARIVSGWASNDGDTKIALKAAERTLLWSWWRISKAPEKDQKKLTEEFYRLIDTYVATSMAYLQKIELHSQVQDGFSGYTSESSVLSLTVFEHIGLVASIGLAAIYFSEAPNEPTSIIDMDQVSRILLGIITKNPVSGSPALDSNTIEVSLALSYLMLAGHYSEAKEWLGEIIGRIDYSYKVMRNFPIGTDSLDDLVELVFGKPEEDRIKELMATSWLLPTLAGWSVILEEEGWYKRVVSGQKSEAYPEVCSQLWHPLKEDFFGHLYFHQAQYECGETEAPIKFPDEIAAYQKHMEAILASERHEVVESSPAFHENLYGLDLIAMRHFKTPVPSNFWYRFLNMQAHP